MNLHFMQDSKYSKKFIEFINNKFNKSDHLYIFKKPSEGFKLISPSDYGNTMILNFDFKKLINNNNKIKKLLQTSTKVFFHYLSFESMLIINRYNPENIYWALWGGDLYSRLNNINLYQDKTKKLLKNENPTFLYNDLSKKIKKYIQSYLFQRTLNKISYILTWNHYDYQIVKNNFKTEAEHLLFTYPPRLKFSEFDNILKGKSTTNIINNKSLKNSNHKKIIQIGNSGDPTNNHLEIMEKLKEIKEKIILLLPLSYGNEEYINKIIKKGEDLFGDNFVPLTEYLSTDKYHNILNEVDILIMNHNRQQGVGNILPMLYFGNKVYINNYVTTYKFFNEKGACIYNTREIFTDDGFDELLNPLKELEIQKNQNIVKEFFNNNIAYEYMKKILQNDFA